MYKLKIYTFITEWNEGTYIQQVEADNFLNAVSNWLYFSTFRTDIGISDQPGDKLLSALNESVFVPLTGLTSIWCTSVIFEDKLLITHAIQTSIDDIESIN